MLARPGAAHERAAGLIGPEHIGGAAEAVHDLAPRLSENGRLRIAPALLRVGEQRLEPPPAVADRIERVIGALLEAVLQQDFLRLQRVGRVGRIDHDGVAANIGKILDVFWT